MAVTLVLDPCLLVYPKAQYWHLFYFYFYYTVYINDIAQHIQSTKRHFADVSIVCREIKNTCDHALLQQDLISLCEWAETWQLKFNVSKCNHLGVTNKVVSFSHNYLMNDIVIAKSPSIKYFGLTLSDN